MKFDILIREILEKTVEVEADTPEDALSKTEIKYHSSDDNYILSAEDYVDTQFEVK